MPDYFYRDVYLPSQFQRVNESEKAPPQICKTVLFSLRKEIPLLGKKLHIVCWSFLNFFPAPQAFPRYSPRPQYLLSGMVRMAGFIFLIPGFSSFLPTTIPQQSVTSIMSALGMLMLSVLLFRIPSVV
jgi:hypothetical protein